MIETAEIYQALIVERARAPRHAGRPAAWDAQGQGDNPLCGDHIELFISQSEAFHESRGCAIMTASADLMADAVAGLSPVEITQLRSAFEAVVNTGTPDPSIGELNALAGVSEYRSRIRCAILPWVALTTALEMAQNG